MRALLGLLTFWVWIASCTHGPQAQGTLQGHVMIGPLVPVVREGEELPTPAPEVYASRQIVIFSPDMRKEILRVPIDGQGNYRCVLPEGKYIVDINHLGIDSAAGLPRTILITADSVMTLDIEIDTGIR